MSTWAAPPLPPLPASPHGERPSPFAPILAGTKPSRFRWAPPLLAVTLALWLGATAAADVTSPRIAQPAIARLLDGLTDTQGLLSVEDARVREAAANAAPGTLIEVPGFPVRGAGIPREDVLGGTPEQWRVILLDRAAVLVYRDGTRPFTEDVEAGDRPLALRLLDEDLHRLLSLARWLPAVATVLLAALTVVALAPVRRWRALGIAVAIGGGMPLTGAVAALLAATVLGGPDGTLSGEAAAIVATLMRGPIIQSGAVTLGGLALWWSARRPVADDDVEARLAAARAGREDRRRAAAGLPPVPRRVR